MATFPFDKCALINSLAFYILLLVAFYISVQLIGEYSIKKGVSLFLSQTCIRTFSIM